MTDYEHESWLALYRAALVELEHAKMSGRIEAARTAISARLEKLRSIPGLHTEERQAIDDARRMLQVLEEEEHRYNREQQRRILEEAEQKLRSIAPGIQKRFNNKAKE